MSAASNVIMEARGLTRRYRHCDAVVDLDLQVPEGSVFAYLGPNGAGKTTTIRLLLNLIHPTAGEAMVFGQPSRRLGREALAQIGYVSADQQLPPGMTVGGILDYLRPMYPSWDPAFVKYLTAMFDLPLNRKVKHLSRGMQRKTALVGALAYRPRLLVMDEPFSGLDPLVRDEFLQGIVEITEQEKWTVFISTHDIDEVERLADRVGILNEGRLELNEEVDGLLQRFRRVDGQAEPSESTPLGLPDAWHEFRQSGRHFELVDSQYDEAKTPALLAQHLPGAVVTETTPMTLKEIFLVLARGFRLTDRNGRGK